MKVFPKLGLNSVLLFVLLTQVTVSFAQTEMFGSTGRFNPPCSGCGGSIGMVDQTTGNYTQLGDPTASDALSGIDFNSAGILFGTENRVGGVSGSASQLITINPATGLLGSVIGSTLDAAGGVVKISDLAFQPGTGVLFGYSSSGKLYTINTTSAVATLVGDTTLSGGGGLAFTSAGVLYLGTKGGIGPPKFVELNPATGAVIGAISTLSNCVDGMGARPGDDVLFATECDDTDIFTIDPVTRQMILVGNSGEFTSDLAFRGVLPPAPPPTPVPVMSHWGGVLLILVLLMGGWLARHNRRFA